MLLGWLSSASVSSCHWRIFNFKTHGFKGHVRHVDLRLSRNKFRLWECYTGCRRHIECILILYPAGTVYTFCICMHCIHCIHCTLSHKGRVHLCRDIPSNELDPCPFSFLSFSWCTEISENPNRTEQIYVCNTIYTVIDVCICAYNKSYMIAIFVQYTMYAIVNMITRYVGCNVRVSTGAWLWTKLWNSRPPHQWDAWSVALPWAATPRPSEQTTEARTVCPTVSLEWKLCSYHVMLYYPFLISTFKVLQASNLKFSGWGCWIRWNLKIFASFLSHFCMVFMICSWLPGRKALANMAMGWTIPKRTPKSGGSRASPSQLSKSHDVFVSHAKYLLLLLRCIPIVL